MKLYPVHLNICNRLCVVVGGGSVAERKTGGLLAGEGRVRIVSPAITAPLQSLVQQGRIEWRGKPYTASDLEGAFLVFAATDDQQVQHAVCKDAQDAGILVNVADSPDDCAFHVPASIRRGDLVVSISTHGRSPALAAMIRRRLETEFGPEYAQLTELMAMIRERILAGEGAGGDKKNLLVNFPAEDILEWLRTGRWDRIRDLLTPHFGQGIDKDLSRLQEEA